MGSANPQTLGRALLQVAKDSPKAIQKRISQVPAVTHWLERALKWMFLLGAIILPMEAWRVFRHGGTIATATQFIMFAFCATVFLLRARLPEKVRLVVYSLFPLAMGTVGLLQWSLCANGMALLLLGSFIAATAGWRYWIFQTGLSLMIVSLIAAGYVSDTLHAGFDAAAYLHSPIAWLIAISGYCVFSIFALLLERVAQDLATRTQELQESEERLRAILDHQYQFSGLLDEDGKVITASPSSLKAVGVDESEIKGSFFWDTPGWRHSIEMQGKMRQAIEDAAAGKPSRFFCSLCTGAGDVRTVDFSLRPVLNEEGQVAYMVPEGRDITDLLETQNALSVSMADLQTIFQQAAVGIAYSDMDGVPLRVNQRLAGLLGLDVEAIVGRGLGTFIHDEDRALARAQLRCLKEKEQASCSFDVRLARPDKSLVWVRFTASAVSDAEEVPQYIVSIVEDITAQKRMQDALDAIVAGTSHVLGKRFFESLVRHLASVLGVRCVAVAELQEVSGDAVHTLAAWYDGRMADTFQWAIANTPCEVALRDGICISLQGVQQAFPKDDRLPRLNAESFLTTLLRDDKGNPLGFLIVLDSKPMQDIRFVKSLVDVFTSRAALEIQRLRAEERERLQQQQLVQADRLASLGILVAGVAHEINNPNGYVRAGIDLLKIAHKDLQPVLDAYPHKDDLLVVGLPLDEAREEIQVLVEQMREGSERIARIVRDLRNFARPESSVMENGINLNKVVDTAARLTGSMIRKKTNRFEVNLADALPAVRGNAQRLEQIVVNLLTNAAQALRSKDEMIRISTRYEEYDDAVIIEVEDQGVGIAPECLKHITDPFYTTKRDEGGTGLGLSISSSIAEEHGGTLRFSSSPGSGTRATLALPTARPAKQELVDTTGAIFKA